MKHAALAVFVLSLIASGCAVDPPAEPVTFARWQRSLERYVWDQADGDPAVLRDLSWDDVHPGYAVLGEALPDRSTDAFGLLLAHRHIDGKPYFIFLVAMIQRGKLERLVPVALDVERGQFHWSVGTPTIQSLTVYRNWLNKSEAGLEVEPHVVHFPAASDTFEVAVMEKAIQIVHDQTGATWRIGIGSHLPASTRAAGSGACD